MSITPAVKAILANYESDNPGVKANLARILMQGKLGGTGKLIILPVDQGFEHGPARSFAVNPAAYDPHYHYQLAIDAGLSRLRRAARHDRGRGRHLRRPDPDHPQGQQLEQLGDVDRPRPSPAASTMRCGSAARRSASPSIRAPTTLFGMMEEIKELRAEAGLGRHRHGDLVLSARRQALEGRRTGARCRRLCRAHGRRCSARTSSR